MSLPAKADDWAECKIGAPEPRIAACTRIIEKGERTAQDLASAYRFRAFAYSRRNETDDAAANINAAIRLHSETAAFSRGYLHLIEKDYDAAISSLSEAIKSIPGNAEIYNLRGVAYARKGDHDRALADYSEAIRLDSASALANSSIPPMMRKAWRRASGAWALGMSWSFTTSAAKTWGAP